MRPLARFVGGAVLITFQSEISETTLDYFGGHK